MRSSRQQDSPCWSAARARNRYSPRSSGRRRGRMPSLRRRWSIHANDGGMVRTLCGTNRGAGSQVVTLVWSFPVPLDPSVSLEEKADSPHAVGCCYISHQRKGIRNDRSTGFASRSTGFVAIGSHQIFCQTNTRSSNAVGKKLIRQPRRLGGNGAGDRRTLPPGSRPVGGGSVRQDYDTTGHGGKGGRDSRSVGGRLTRASATLLTTPPALRLDVICQHRVLCAAT